MLDEFLKVAYAADVKKQDDAELVALLRRLPQPELSKIASGVPIARMYPHLTKVADDFASSPDSPDAPQTFLDRFKGTPLFDQAVALEQQQLQLDMQQQTERAQRMEQERSTPPTFEARDRIGIQKRLLEVELAKVQESAAMGGPPADQGAPPMPGPPELGGDAGAIPPPSPAAAAPPMPDAMKMGSAEPSLRDIGARAGVLLAKTAAPAFGIGALGAQAVQVGKHIAYVVPKAATQAAGAIAKTAMTQERGTQLGTRLGVGGIAGSMAGNIAGHALGMPNSMLPTAAGSVLGTGAGAIYDRLKGAGKQKVALAVPPGMAGALEKGLAFAAKKPALVGAGLGAAGGAIAGGPNHRLSGAVVGGGLGAASGSMGAQMLAGKGLGAAAASTGRGALNGAMRGVNTAAGAVLPEAAAARVGAGAAGLNQAGHDAISALSARGGGMLGSAPPGVLAAGVKPPPFPVNASPANLGFR